MTEFVDPVRNIQSIGPFHRYPVVINSWSVPHLEAQKTRHGITLTLDYRFQVDLNAETEPGEIIAFIANAIAVAKGHACHPYQDGWAWADEDRMNPPFNPMWPWRHYASGNLIGWSEEEK